MVNKITTPPTQNEVISKINELVDDKQDVITSSNKLSASLVSGLATVATSGNYNDLSNKPTIPTVNNATLTIQKNGTNVATFTANASSNVTANISVPNVTSTYTATGTDAVNGVAVSNAIATKQDNLVSGTNIKTINGTSILGSGNITIETSSTLNVDGETISYNMNDALQAIAVKNVRDGSTLPIWHGTEQQWNRGVATTWYYWQTATTALWTASTLLSSASWQSVTYGDGKFVAVASSSNKAAYSTDGINWTASTLPSSASWQSVTYGDGKFVAVTYNSDASAIFTIQYDKCYTDTANPTTTSTVYSKPEVTSSYSISSVTSGAITLSNNNTYYYNQSGNAYTYQSVGVAHPEYLCFIDGVGVKIGTTTIATNS